MIDVIVIGGGIAGLTTAFRLLRAGKNVICLETNEEPGGCVRTEKVGGYLCERGAQNFLEAENGAVQQLARELGIADQIVPARDTHNYIAMNGRCWSVPSQVHRVLSFSGLLRAGLDIFLPRGTPDAEESIAAWARRRFGNKAALRLIDPMVSGVYAGDPERLSLQATFSLGAELEEKYRSVLIGTFRHGGERRKALSFHQGMGTLSATLAQKLGYALQSKTEACRITRDVAGSYRIDANATSDKSLSFQAREIVVATPAAVAARLVTAVDPMLAKLLDGISYATMVSAWLGFLPTDFHGSTPQGYGLIRPHCDGSRALGCLFSSSAFADASPSDRVLIRVMMGGQREPEAIALSDNDLVARALQEFGSLLGLKPGVKPAFVHIIRTRPGLPQYELGHLQRLHGIQTRIKDLAGLHLVGNAYRGVPVVKVIEQANQLVAGILKT